MDITSAPGKCVRVPCGSGPTRTTRSAPLITSRSSVQWKIASPTSRRSRCSSASAASAPHDGRHISSPQTRRSQNAKTSAHPCSTEGGPSPSTRSTAPTRQTPRAREGHPCRPETIRMYAMHRAYSIVPSPARHDCSSKTAWASCQPLDVSSPSARRQPRGPRRRAIAKGIEIPTPAARSAPLLKHNTRNPRPPSETRRPGHSSPPSRRLCR